MTPDAEQNDLLLGYLQDKGDAIAVSEADCMATGKRKKPPESYPATEHRRANYATG